MANRLFYPVGNSWALNTAQRLFRIACSPLPTALKRKVFSTETRLSARRLMAGQPKEIQCPILDFQVSAYSLELLDYLFKELFVDLDYYFETGQSSPFIIDCGSNIGMSILFFKSLYPGSSVVGIEPSPDSFALLRRNIEANKLNNVIIHQSAVGAVAGEVSFFRGVQPGSLMASTNAHRASGAEEKVAQMRLSSLIDREVDFLKLDVEGAEDGVMADLFASGRLRNIAQMVVEYHHNVNGKEGRFSSFLAQLEEAGFGYQLRCALSPRRTPGQMQDVLVYAYRKD
jgi:FkbM family methyltransferase